MPVVLVVVVLIILVLAVVLIVLVVLLVLILAVLAVLRVVSTVVVLIVVVHLFLFSAATRQRLLQGKTSCRLSVTGVVCQQYAQTMPQGF